MLKGSTNEEKIWNFLKDAGLNDCGAAGLMGNLYAESGLRPDNLQNSFEKKLGHTDASYTAAVDSGSYTDFVRDGAGYGLAQWTYWSRKQGLLDYVQARGASIGDMEAQLGYLLEELGKSYRAVLTTLKTAGTVEAASNAVLLQFERPADQSAAAQTKRAGYGKTYYEKYAKKEDKPMGAFQPRLTRPTAGNKYYITKAAGGYSDAIQGKPADSQCNVLANCVGYAYGRFNEIGGYGCCKYLRPVNAERFMQYANGLTVGQTPKLGACMVWQKGATLNGSDGAGHVAIVEQIISETEIVTSESGYNSTTPFWTKRRKKGTGNWGAGSGYTFLGFIYNPAVSDSTVTTAPGTAAPATGNGLEFKVGDVVEFVGDTHYTNAAAATGKSCKPGPAKVTAISRNSRHPYHLIHTDTTSTVYGWVDADDVAGEGDGGSASLAVGDKVKMTSGATVYGTMSKFSSWVYSATLYVRGISGDRIVVSTQKTGAVTGAVDKKYLTKA